MPSYDSLIDSDDVNELITIRDSLTDNSFRVGDLTNKYLERKEIYRVSKAFIYSAVGSFSGKKARSVREYARIAEFFPQSVRNEYPVLSMDHYRYAISCPDWRQVLEFAISQDSRPATVDDCIRKFGYRAQDESSLEAALAPIRKYIIRLPNAIRDQVEKILDQLEELLESGK